MRIAVFESILTPAGHEVDFDKMLVSELQSHGHEVELYVPENYRFKLDYNAPVRHLRGEGVSYAGASGMAKMLLSGKREIRRLNWFNALYEHACAKAFDAVIIPTATYRFLRSIRWSSLKKSPVPIIPIIHGVNAGEASNFVKQVKALAAFPNIKTVVITLAPDIFGERLSSVECVRPPVFPPMPSIEPSQPEVLTLGFFGQYRREKNLDAFLKVFSGCNFEAPVKLLVQGATILREDAEDFERIRREYAALNNVEFLHKALIGEEWQQAIAGISALIMPYSSERYLYHWSAMLFTAVGFAKPVIIADTINPEVLKEYDVGLAFSPKDSDALRQVLEQFVNTYAAKREIYRRELARANEEFAPGRFAGKISEIIQAVRKV